MVEFARFVQLGLGGVVVVGVVVFFDNVDAVGVLLDVRTNGQSKLGTRFVAVLESERKQAVLGLV